MPSIFTLAESVSQGVVYLTLGGEIDLSVSDTIRTVITGHLSTDATAGVVVDLDRVTFLDSSGISALVKGRNVADQHGVLFRVVNARDKVLEVLELTGLSEHLGLDEIPAGRDVAEMS